MMANSTQVLVQPHSQEKDVYPTIINKDQNTKKTSNMGSSILVQDSKCLDEDVKPSKKKLQFLIPKHKTLSGGLLPTSKKKPKWEPQINKEEKIPMPGARKTRWGVDLTQDPDVKIGRALALQTRAEQIAAQLESGKLESNLSDFTRSPSPPPIYDSNGQRINTREGRKREQLELERREAIAECIKLNPKFKVPTGYKPLQKEATLLIPVKDYPGYNFIGLILGPRGNTQKRMEMATGAKIAIRGKGAIKEGKLIQGARYSGKDADGGNDDLHVYITGDSYDKIDAAVALIKPLLTPVDELTNAHKKNQLRELAEMNGTVREPLQCSICGDPGHRDWFCPNEKTVLPPGTKIMCDICGDGSHPTIDCSKVNLASKGKVLDTEYLSFLQELGDGIATSTSTITSSNTTTLKCQLPQLVQQKSGNENINLPMLITATGPKPIPSTWSSNSKEEGRLLKPIGVPNPLYSSQIHYPQNFFHSCNRFPQGTHSNTNTIYPNTMESSSGSDTGSQFLRTPIQSSSFPETSSSPSSLHAPIFPNSPIYLTPFTNTTTPPNGLRHPLWGTSFGPSSPNFPSPTPWIQPHFPPHFWSSISKSAGTVASTTSSVNNTISSKFLEKGVAYGESQSTSSQVEKTSTSSQSLTLPDACYPSISQTVSKSPLIASYLNALSNSEPISTTNLNTFSSCPASNTFAIHPLEATKTDCNIQGQRLVAQGPLTNHFFPPWTGPPPFCPPSSINACPMLNPMLPFSCNFQYPSSNLATTPSNLQSFSSSQPTFQSTPSTLVPSSNFETTKSSSSFITSPMDETVSIPDNTADSSNAHSTFQTPPYVESPKASNIDMVSGSSHDEAECEYERILALIGVK